MLLKSCIVAYIKLIVYVKLSHLVANRLMLAENNTYHLKTAADVALRRRGGELGLGIERIQMKG